MQYSECLSTPFPFYHTQIFTPFLNSKISANRNKRLGFQPIVKSLYPLMFLQCRISFDTIYLFSYTKIEFNKCVHEMSLQDILNYFIQSAKIFLLPSKCEIIMLPSNHSNFRYCDSNIGLLSIALCKVISLNPFLFSSLLLF